MAAPLYHYFFPNSHLGKENWSGWWGLSGRTAEAIELELLAWDVESMITHSLLHLRYWDRAALASKLQSLKCANTHTCYLPHPLIKDNVCVLIILCYTQQLIEEQRSCPATATPDGCISPCFFVSWTCGLPSLKFSNFPDFTILLYFLFRADEMWAMACYYTLHPRYPNLLGRGMFRRVKYLNKWSNASVDNTTISCLFCCYKIVISCWI